MPHNLRDAEDNDAAAASSLDGERLTGFFPGQKVIGDRSQEELWSTSKNGLHDVDPAVIAILCLVHLSLTGLCSPGFSRMEMLLQVFWLGYF